MVVGGNTGGRRYWQWNGHCIVSIVIVCQVPGQSVEGLWQQGGDVSRAHRLMLSFLAGSLSGMKSMLDWRYNCLLWLTRLDGQGPLTVPLLHWTLQKFQRWGCLPWLNTERV